jgi:DNA-binding NarL/FixJ family response regulator
MASGKVHDSTYIRDARVARSRVFILSDFRILREGLVLALAQQPSIMVVGTSVLPISPGEIARLCPDVLILDTATAGGLNLSASLRELLPDMRIVAIAVAEVEDEVISFAKGGVVGFVSREGSIQDVATAVHCAMRGEFVCPPRVASLLLAHVGAVSATRSDISSVECRLTRREREIVSFVGDGLSNKEIACVLQIRVATVKNHVHSILAKMQMRRRAEVAARFRGVAPTSPNSINVGSLQIG